MEKRCFACMNKISSDKCAHCGVSNSDFSDVSREHLTPGILLEERYMIGFAIEQNGEGITYMAYDEQEKRRVRIREFFPGTLCSRDLKENRVIIQTGYEIQFKTLLTDFAELSKQLMELKANHCLVKPISMFAANDTLYVVYEDVVGVTLTRFLRENAGELNWEDTENLFLPLLYTVKLLNSYGITHRGISPETIIVTPQNELKLSGVCISAARATNSEIKSELFIGYAAPEQYQKCTSYGEWTDVYSLCAVLYKTLTGTMPPRADIRDANGILITPHQLNASIPKSVSDAIAHGLVYDQEKRTRYVKHLISALYASQTTTIDRNDIYLERENSTKRRKFRLPVWLIVILIALPIMLLLFFFMYQAILGPKTPNSSNSSMVSSELELSSEEVSSESSSEQETSSNVVNIAVDNFVDQFYDDVIASKTYETMYTFKKEEKYDDYVPFGYIISQTPEADTILPQGIEVTLTVSKGLKVEELPPFTDENGVSIPLDAYQKVVLEKGFEVKIETIDDFEHNSGEIVDLNVQPNTPIDRETNNTIIIYVAK